MKAAAFGEILWDVFEDVRTLGGAPLNVLAHLSKLGADCSIVSAVGRDSLGEDTLERVRQLGINGEYIFSSQYPTGKAEIELKDGIPGYSFNFPCAWDDIRPDDGKISEFLSEHYSVFIYGTLSQRSDVSRATLERILSSINADEFFFDVNFRKDFFSREILEKGFRKATIVKMNDEEIPVAAALFGISAGSFVSALQDRWNVERVVVTLGKEGSVCFSGGKEYRQSSGKVRVVDTVGAGDSFSAAFLDSLARGYDERKAMERASLLADYVVAHEGATPDYDESIRKALGI